MTDDVVVRTEGLSKAYGATVALRDVDLALHRGEVFGYLGPNGAGKTTTLRTLMGLLRPTSGRAEVLGLDPWRDAVEVHRRVGYLPGEPGLYERMTGHDHISYLAHLRRVDRRDGEHLARRLDLDLDHKVRALSKGNRQKVAIVLALMGEPELLLLDEPTSGLDPLVQQEFYALLSEHRRRGGCVLLSSHVLGEVQRVADRVGVLRAGRLVAVDRLEDLRAKSLHHVVAHFADPVDAAEFVGVPQLQDLSVDAGVLRCSAPEGSLDPLLKQIARHHVADLECAEAELEETFLAYYGAEVSP